MRFYYQFDSILNPKIHQNRVLEASWGVLRVSWGCLGASQGCLGASCGRLGASWSVLEPSWSALEASWERLEVVLGWLRRWNRLRSANRPPARAGREVPPFRGRGRVNPPPGLEDWEDWRVGSLVVGSTRHEAQGLGGLSEETIRAQG